MVAYFYKFDPITIWEMDLKDLFFWIDGLPYISKIMAGEK